MASVFGRCSLHLLITTANAKGIELNDLSNAQL